MSEETKEEGCVAAEAKESRFAELEALQQEIERRIRDNKRFLEHFLEDDFADDEAAGEDDAGEDFEEL